MVTLREGVHMKTKEYMHECHNFAQRNGRDIHAALEETLYEAEEEQLRLLHHARDGRRHDSHGIAAAAGGGRSA